MADPGRRSLSKPSDQAAIAYAVYRKPLPPAERPGAAPTDEELLKLLQRKALLEGELEELKIRRAFLAADEYAKEFERIITEYARVSSEIRKRTKT